MASIPSGRHEHSVRSGYMQFPHNAEHLLLQSKQCVVVLYQRIVYVVQRSTHHWTAHQKFCRLFFEAAAELDDVLEGRTDWSYYVFGSLIAEPSTVSVLVISGIPVVRYSPMNAMEVTLEMITPAWNGS